MNQGSILNILSTPVIVFSVLIILAGVKYLTVGLKKSIYNLHAIKPTLWKCAIQWFRVYVWDY